MNSALLGFIFLFVFCDYNNASAWSDLPFWICAPSCAPEASTQSIACTLQELLGFLLIVSRGIKNITFQDPDGIILGAFPKPYPCRGLQKREGA
jgi:hypothetical protein